jgi:hypothetical protein
MPKNIPWLVPALLALVCATPSPAQPPGPPDGPRRPGPGGIERVVDDLKLPDSKRDLVIAAVRNFDADVRRMNELSTSSTLLKLKDVLTSVEFTKLKESVDELRRFPGAGRQATIDDVIARLMSFDKNGDGKLTKDELPERMQDLIARGDTNKDGALDKEEIRKLAAELAREESGRGGPGGGPGGRPNQPGRPVPPAALERAVNDLKLTDSKKESAATVLAAHKDSLRNLTQLARAEVLLKVSDQLSTDELRKLEAVLDRPIGPPPFGPPGPGGPGGRPRPDRP